VRDNGLSGWVASLSLGMEPGLPAAHGHKRGGGFAQGRAVAYGHIRRLLRPRELAGRTSPLPRFPALDNRVCLLSPLDSHVGPTLRVVLVRLYPLLSTLF
jgi:hypothetical protein